MKTINILLITLLIVLALIFPAPHIFALPKTATGETPKSDFKFKTRQSVRYDISEDHEDWYVFRLWGESYYKPRDMYNTFKVAPFFETRYHFHSKQLCRTEIGVEVGTDLFKWLYWGESLQYAVLHPGRDGIELESTLIFNWPFRIKGHDFTAYLFEEHTYAFVFGEGTINEFGVTLTWQPGDNTKFLFGWRHTDRIHYYDTDQIELAVIFNL